MKKNLNDRALDALADGKWKPSIELLPKFRGDFNTCCALTNYLKRMMNGGFIKGEFSGQWYFAALDTPSFGEAERVLLDRVFEVVKEIISDGKWYPAREIMEKLPADLSSQYSSVTMFSKALVKLCEAGRLQLVKTSQGRIYALPETSAPDIRKAYRNVLKLLEGKAILTSELRNHYMTSPIDIDEVLQKLIETGAVRKANCHSAYCGAGYIEDAFFDLNAAFVRMAAQTTTRNPYEYMR